MTTNPPLSCSCGYAFILADERGKLSPNGHANSSDVKYGLSRKFGSRTRLLDIRAVQKLVDEELKPRRAGIGVLLTSQGVTGATISDVRREGWAGVQVLCKYLGIRRRAGSLVRYGSSRLDANIDHPVKEGRLEIDQGRVRQWAGAQSVRKFPQAMTNDPSDTKAGPKLKTWNLQ